MLEIYEMIELLDDFVNDNTRQVQVVGGITGTDIFRMTVDAALGKYNFSKVLMIEGCYDYIGMNKNGVVNYVYYANLFLDVPCNPLTPIEPFTPKLFRPKIQFEIRIDTRLISGYQCIIINNAHLIPIKMLEAIIQYAKNQGSKVCVVIDPFDIGGENWRAPTITDSLSKLSSLTAMAREIYNVDTRCIDKRVKGGISEAKVNRRSIGKIDDKQYITNDDVMLDAVRHKQLQTPFRKNQKVIVTDNSINATIDQYNSKMSLFKNSMCVIMSPISSPMLKLRFFNSQNVYYAAISYLDDAPRGTIKVKPANILSAVESSHHRYNTSVIIGVEQMNQREKYSIIKNSKNVIIGHLS